MQEQKIRRGGISGSILIILSIISFVLVAYISFQMFSHNFLPLKYRWAVAAVGTLFSLGLFIMGATSGSLGKRLFGILLSAGYLAVLIIGISYLTTSISALHEIAKSGEVKNKTGVPAIKVKGDESFVVYFSGTDVYGDLSQSSRSDVNIVAAVNPVKKQIAIVSVPRDSYLRIAGDGNWNYDKLTHAGNYGIEAQIQTLERALNTDINYYVRMNFTSFMEVISAIGGVEVVNDQEFTAIDGQHFEKGPITLNEEQALMFVRERKHLNNGDFDRQKHQMMVMEAIFRKLVSPSMILNFSKVMATVSESIETNMPYEHMTEFINAQIDSNASWSFENLKIQGESQFGLESYAMPDQELYFFVPDEDSMDEIRDIISRVKAGTYVSGAYTRKHESASDDAKSDTKEPMADGDDTEE